MKKFIIVIILTILLGCSSLNNFKNAQSVDAGMTSGEITEVVKSVVLTQKELEVINEAQEDYLLIRSLWESTIEAEGIEGVFSDIDDVRKDYKALKAHYDAVYKVAATNWLRYSEKDRQYLHATSQEFIELDKAFKRASKLENYKQLAEIIIKSAIKAASFITRMPI